MPCQAEGVVPCARGLRWKIDVGKYGKLLLSLFYYEINTRALYIRNYGICMLLFKNTPLEL